MPYTIDGTPARFAMLSCTRLRQRLALAYSSRYTAAPTPIGTENSVVSPISQMLLTSAGKMPAFAGNRDG